MIKTSSSRLRDDIVTDLLPDLTPLIDVMFMLIIFLVLTANSALQYFDIALPEEELTTETIQQSETPLNITVFPELDQWAINDTRYKEFTSFKAALLSQLTADSDTEVIIFSDKTVTVEKLLKLLNLLEQQQASISRFAIE